MQSKYIYRIEPLPAGTQRASLVATLRQFGWNAKPLQPSKGSQGQAWQVGASTEPPHPFIETQHGWIGITKIKGCCTSNSDSRFDCHGQDQAAHQGIPRTCLQQYCGHRTHGRQALTHGVAMFRLSPSQHPCPCRAAGMKKLQIALQQHVEEAISKGVEQMQLDPQSSSRLTAVESQIQSLVDNQSRLEHWITDGSSKVQTLQQDCVQLQHQVTQQGTDFAERSHWGVTVLFQFDDRCTGNEWLARWTYFTSWHLLCQATVSHWSTVG